MKRSTKDRRSPISRRKGFDLDAINKLGEERRSGPRRSHNEKRNDWVRVEGEQISVPAYKC